MCLTVGGLVWTACAEGIPCYLTLPPYGSQRGQPMTKIFLHFEKFANKLPLGDIPGDRLSSISKVHFEELWTTHPVVYRRETIVPQHSKWNVCDHILVKATVSVVFTILKLP